MSLMSLGCKMTLLKNQINNGALLTKNQVKKTAEEMNIASCIGYETLSAEEKNLWYDQLSENLFVNHNNWIPCFIDIGFGRELLNHSSNLWNYRVPKKQHWKFIITREKFSDWQFNAIVHCYTQEEAVCILQKYFGDFGDLGFNYSNADSSTLKKSSWVEINSKTPGSYINYLRKESCVE